MLTLTEHIKLSYVRNLRGNAFKGEILYGTLLFQQGRIIYIHLYLAAILEGKSMPSKMAAKTTFCLYC